MLNNKFEDLMNQLVLEKNKHKVSLEQIANGSGLSRPCVTRLISVNQRSKASIDSLLKVINYFDGLNGVVDVDKSK